MKCATEEQLQFAFFTAMEPLSLPPQDTLPPRTTKTKTKLPSLTEMLTDANAVLLEASLSEVDAQLFPLLEFCEAALTRALDVAPARAGEIFSAEEYRSLRGIGQAQWLLTEARSEEN